MGAATDAATGEVLGLDALVERDSDGFMEWLGDFVSGCGVEAMVSDDLIVERQWTGSSDLHSPREEAGSEASRQDRRLGLGQGEDMAAAD